jgi:hypothetical protein
VVAGGAGSIAFVSVCLCAIAVACVGAFRGVGLGVVGAFLDRAGGVWGVCRERMGVIGVVGVWRMCGFVCGVCWCCGRGCRICVLGMVVFFVVCGVWWLCGVGLGGEFSNTLRGREGVRKFGKILTPFFGVPRLRKGNLSGGGAN